MYRVVIFAVGFAVLGRSYSEPYKELVPGFNRAKSPVMLREIDLPTRANLDYAAYNNNPVRFNPEKFKPAKPKEKIRIDSLRFNGALSGCVASLEQTPLTKEELGKPMAWEALKNLIWEKTKTDDIAAIASKINGYKWADPSIYPPYQQLVTSWIHEGKEGPGLWVKIEFAPWVKFLKGLKDSDGDGFKEIYGQLNLSSIPPEKMSGIFSWMQNRYLTETLSKTEVLDWAQLLASYWYPSLNTDILHLPENSNWPNEETEKKVKKALKKISIHNPTVVIRGNPLGKPIYNIFHVPQFKEKKTGTEKAAVAQNKDVSTGITKKAADISGSKNYQENQERFKKELEPFGSYLKWDLALKEGKSALQSFLNNLPESALGFEAKNNWLFFRKSLEYSLADSLEFQGEDYNPLPHIIALKNYFKSQGIDFLFVPVPPKTEIYPEYLKGSKFPGEGIVNPWGRRFLQSLQDSLVEVVDLLPVFMEAKKSDAKNSEPIYQHHDTHWTSRGLKMAAQKLASRIRQYDWYEKLGPDTSLYTALDSLVSRKGDIVDRLPEGIQGKYPAAMAHTTRVFKNGLPFASDKNGPVLLMGDSFTGVFELIDGKSGGVGAHISMLSGLDSDIITSWGGGPLVRKRMLKARKNNLGEKFLVIYMMAARDLYKYSQKWERLNP